MALALAEKRAVKLFVDRFGAAPELVVRSPGRVNLIGDHTDYNDGFVLPMAINREVWLALRPRADRRVVAISEGFDQVEIDLDAVFVRTSGWGLYVQGVAWSLQEAGLDLRGWEGVIVSDVAVGAGLSSSAALELAVARGFAAVSAWEWDPLSAARWARRAENEWVGVATGIMDQLVGAKGRQGHAILIDCRSLAVEAIPLPPGVAVMVIDSGTRRQLVDSAYNERRAQCEAASVVLGVPALRDTNLVNVEKARHLMDPTTFRRARHVVTENARTLEAAGALRSADPVALGRLMDQSHQSLRDDFEVSTPALDRLVQISKNAGALGARMTGAGFGGCVVALVPADDAGRFTVEVTVDYTRAKGLMALVYRCAAVDGTSVAAVGR